MPVSNIDVDLNLNLNLNATLDVVVDEQHRMLSFQELSVYQGRSSSLRSPWT
jgi:hypothetical protein